MARKLLKALDFFGGKKEEESIIVREIESEFGLRFCKDLLLAFPVFQRHLQLLLHLIYQLESLLLTCCGRCSRSTQELVSFESIACVCATGTLISRNLDFGVPFRHYQI